MVGAVFDFELPQPAVPQIAAIKIAQEMKRTVSLFIPR
jgi:hypothetical protein